MRLILGILFLLPLAAQTVRTVCASGCGYTSVSAAVTAASGGDVVELTAGETFTEENWALPNKSNTEYITIRSSKVGELTPGQRVTPSDVAKLATITASAWSDYYVVGNESGAGYYRFHGIKFVAPALFEGDLIEFGTRSSNGSTEMTREISGYAHDIDFDQCWFSGAGSRVRRGIRANAYRISVINSWFDDIAAKSYEDAGTSVESNAIGGWSLAGSIMLRNNHLEAVGITTLFGGGEPSINGVRADGIWFIGNHYYRSWKWRTRYSDGDPTGTCLYDSGGGEWYKNTAGGAWNGTGAGVKYWQCVAGTWTEVTSGDFPKHYIQKNTWELKNAWRVWVEGNYLENAWQPADYNQYGALFLFNVVDDTVPSATIGYVSLANNYARRAAYGVQMGNVGSAYFKLQNNITFDNNLWEQMGDPGVTETSLNHNKFPQAGNIGTFFFSIKGTAQHIRYIHNTVNASWTASPGGIGFGAVYMSGNDPNQYGDPTQSPNASIVGNILPWGFSGFHSDSNRGHNWGAVPFELATSRDVSRNLVINDQSQSIYGTAYPVVNLTWILDGPPPGCPLCAFPAAWTNVGTVDYANGNYRLDSGSAYKAWAPMGRDPGADQDVVEWSTATSTTGAYNPYLDFKVRTLTAASTSLAFRYTAYDTSACTVAVSTKPDMSSPSSVTDSGGDQDRLTSVTGLTANTRYFWSLTCGTHTRKGIALTTP